MIENLIQNTAQYISTNIWLAFVFVFLGGLTTAANPCVIASIPLIMGVIGASREKVGLSKALGISLSFASGLTIMFTIMGLVAALIGSVFGDLGSSWKYIISLVCVLMGIYLTGFIKVYIPTPNFLKTKKTGAFAGFILGFFFGIVSAPCAAPILIIILTYIASKGSIIYGILLLLTYSFAHCILIIVAGTSVGILQSYILNKGLQSANLWVKRIAGILIMLVGIYILIK